MNLREINLNPIQAFEEARFQRLTQAHHYLGALPTIGCTLWYVASSEHYPQRTAHSPTQLRRLEQICGASSYRDD